MRLVLVLLFSSAIISTYAQRKTNEELKTVSAELGKVGLLFNLSFDYRWKNSPFGGRVFLGSNFARYLSAATAGLGGYAVFGSKWHMLETGVDIAYLDISEISDDQFGFALIYPSYSIKGISTSLNVGYRNRYKDNIFRIGVSPTILKDVFIPGGYFSYGRGF
jgi:hypothetical protein